METTASDPTIQAHPSCDICVIDDDRNDRELMLAILQKVGYACVAAESGEEGLKLIHDCKPKVVISDWILPEMDGLAVCETVRNNPELASTFCIMVTACSEQGSRNLALGTCADDYLTKPVDRPTLIARTRVGMRLWDANERLRHAAITDGLTGLYNHDHLNNVLDREFNRARRYGGRLALIMADLDFFKAVNDTYGHLVGNETLADVARIMKEKVREFDTVGRYGGEEFAVVAPEASLEDAVAICQRIRLAVAETLNVPALRDHQVTASFGVATVDDARVRQSSDLIDLADQALYASKRIGRNRVTAAIDIDGSEPAIGVESKEIEALRKRVAILGVQAKEVYVQSVASLVQALEEKDPFTAKHSLNVAYYCEQLARWMELNDPLTDTIRNAGLLHDIGKVGIPDRILVKPTGLSDTEAMVMRQVPAISVRILDHLRILDSEMHIIAHQREYYDGTGYPDGLRGDQIPIGSRIVLVANAFDAMTTDRVYRPCKSINEAVSELKSAAGKQFDPKVVTAMADLAKQHSRNIKARIKSTADSLRAPAMTY